MAEQMSSKVNAVLAAGKKSDGSAGEPLLEFNPTSATGLLQVTSGFKTTDLAFSSDGTPGDSGNLQLLIDIKGQPINLSSLGSVLLGDADTQIVGKLGIDSQQNQSQLTPPPPSAPGRGRLEVDQRGQHRRGSHQPGGIPEYVPSEHEGDCGGQQPVRRDAANVRLRRT
jgi:CO dehydrogenase/acetyl-CoA synthase gamma subunit (corrinoid Fe-S protein)